jgi:hypothetical protein
VLHVSNALVTGAGASGFFVQVKEGDTGYAGAPNSGVFVFTGTGAATLANATVGARVDIDGSFDVFGGESELDNITAVTVDAVGPEAPPAAISVQYADVATGGSDALALEGVIVTVPTSTATAVNTTAGEFTVTAGSASLIVGSFLSPFSNPAVNQTYNSITGVLSLRQSASKLQPRSAGDISLGPPGLASLAPGASFIRVGDPVGPSFPSNAPLTVTLTGPAQGDTVVTISSSDPSVTIAGGGVTVLNGTTSAVVQLSGTTQLASVTLTATLVAETQQATIRVLGAAEQPQAVTLSPGAVAIAPNGQAKLTVTLDIPAASTGTTVALSQNPTSGTLPPSVIFAADTQVATVTYTDSTGSGTAITATLGASTSTTNVTISTSVPHIVINEVDYDQVGSDFNEYIEIYNPTSQDADLTNLELMLVNGANSQVYSTITLASIGTLPAGQYLVITGTTVSVAPGALELTPTGWKAQDNIQNGNPDGMALVDTTGPSIVDALSYGGSITAATLTGFATPQSLVFGTPTAVKDSNTVLEALCRFPNGQASGDDAADWQLCKTLTPGAANSQ